MSNPFASPYAVSGAWKKSVENEESNATLNGFSESLRREARLKAAAMKAQLRTPEFSSSIARTDCLTYATAPSSSARRKRSRVVSSFTWLGVIGVNSMHCQFSTRGQNRVGTEQNQRKSSDFELIPDAVLFQERDKFVQVSLPR